MSPINTQSQQPHKSDPLSEPLSENMKRLIENIKADFPIFDTYPNLVYLDSAATSQKPRQVVEAVSNFYTHSNANIHRGIYDLSQRATDQFEACRQNIADFIGADASEIIFTASATEVLNLIAYCWASKHLKPGDIIVLSVMEHHSNFVPWLRLRKRLGVELVFLPIDDDYRLRYKDVLAPEQYPRVKLIALTHASNVLGTINPVAEIKAHFQQQGASSAKLAVDAAQSVVHLPVDVNELGADFLAFSSHKMYGPSGVGVLFAKQELLAVMEPLITGGHMVDTVRQDGATWLEPPGRFEPGTRNLEGVIGLGAAIDYLAAVGISGPPISSSASVAAVAASAASVTSVATAHNQALVRYGLQRFAEQNQMEQSEHFALIGPHTPENRLPIFSFNIPPAHPHDVAEILNREQIAVRAGHHCAQPLMQHLGVGGTVRASLALYNSLGDIDQLMSGLAAVQRIFR